MTIDASKIGRGRPPKPPPQFKIVWAPHRLIGVRNPSRLPGWLGVPFTLVGGSLLVISSVGIAELFEQRRMGAAVAVLVIGTALILGVLLLRERLIHWYARRRQAAAAEPRREAP
ncbi:MAG: hypothetical protein ABL907_19830 [Hyphomicrobium sp.]